jgi:hypothetical protein
LLLDFLTAENVWVRILQEIHKALSLAGLHAIYIPGNNLHEIVAPFGGFALIKEESGQLGNLFA